MTQLHIPAEYADAVREAMTCSCAPYWPKGHHDHVCSCESSFWWGVVANVIDNRIGDNFGQPKLPADVRAMFDPCNRCDGTGICHCHYCIVKERDSEQCDNCIDGRPLVKLVTDCPHGTTCDPSKTPPDLVPCPGYDTLGFVTATEVLPIELNAASERTRDHVAISYVYDPQGEAFIWRTDRTVTDITLIGPSDADHAVLLWHSQVDKL